MQRAVRQLEGDRQDVELVAVAAPPQPMTGRGVPGVLRVARVADELLGPEPDRRVVDRRDGTDPALVGGQPEVLLQVRDDVVRLGEVGAVADDEALPARTADTAVSHPPGVAGHPGQGVVAAVFVAAVGRFRTPGE